MNSHASDEKSLTFVLTSVLLLLGPYAWMVGAEYPNNHLRAHTFGLATALNFLGNWIGIFTAPYFINPASLGWSAKYGCVSFPKPFHNLLFNFIQIFTSIDMLNTDIYGSHQMRLYFYSYTSSYRRHGVVLWKRFMKCSRSVFRLGDSKVSCVQQRRRWRLRQLKKSETRTLKRLIRHKSIYEVGSCRSKHILCGISREEIGSRM